MGCNIVKKISLTQGQVALVDNEDYDWLNQYKWYADKRRGNFYAIRSSWKNGKHYPVYMHREILKLKRGDKRQGDHINHNILDNKRENLRICTNRQNGMNQKVHSNSTSQFKGVCWHKVAKKWIANITIEGKTKHIGLFGLEENAALAYNKAAKKYFGNFAYLNVLA